MSAGRDLEAVRNWVVRVVDLIGCPPARQLEYIKTERVGVDEIALQFDDVLNLVQGAVDEGSLSPEILELLLPIDSQLKEMTESKEDLWDDESLSEASEWDELRLAAQQALVGFERIWE
ncbi:hypothetical protein ACFV84_04580 [Kitasatospora sp. NPDC059811]|uniref:hypothetical protein n=1 Tax=Streptomycetaceae TaxID=2062 RepID=UPI0007AF86B2|nr:hypothetical protein [Streptomyces sp. MJM8645]